MISQTSEQDKAQGTINILQAAELRTNIVTNGESDEGASKQANNSYRTLKRVLGRDKEEPDETGPTGIICSGQEDGGDE
jgi:hypothetical protein